MSNGEEEKKPSGLSRIVFAGVLCFLFGASIVGLVLWPVTLPEPVVGGLLGEPVCLSPLDLNRDDVYAGMFFGRHCESLGFVSAVFWQETETGERYAIPVCLEPIGGE